MKKLLTILFVLTSFFASAQKLDSIRGAGFIWERGMFNKSLGIPTVCGVPKTNYTDSTKKAQIIYDSCAGKFYAYNPATESWSEPGGGGVSGVDSVTIVQTGCAFTFYTWQGGVSTAVGTLSQYNGLTPGTGLVTRVSGTTFNVTAAVYAIDCVTYVTRDTTITLPAAGDTGRIDVIKVNTSSVTTYGQGVEGEALPLPSLSSTELALTYILVTDTGVFVSPPADTALWVSVGNEIRNANTGRVRVKRDLQVGNYAPGPWDTTGVHTNTYMVAQDGFYTTNPSNSSLTKNGIGQGFGNAINMWAGTNIIGTWGLVGNGTGNQFRIFGGMNPSTGTGEGNGVLIDPALSPSGANSKSYNMLKIAPTYTQGTFGTGTLRGIYYNPIVTSLNTSTHYFIESTSGLVKLAGIGTEVDTTTWKPMVKDASGNVRSLTYWPVGSGGGGSGWGLTGNSGTAAGTNFLGTTDAAGLMFKVNDVQSGYIDMLGNTAFGYSSFILNSTGTSNVAIGSSAMLMNTDGILNTAAGNESLKSNSEGQNNVAIGNGAASANTTGDSNTSVGSISMQTNATGELNTVIGYNADVATSSTSNAIAIGADAVAASNQLAISGNIYRIKAVGLGRGTAGMVLTDSTGNGDFVAQALTDSTIYFESPLEVYTSGDSNKIRINPDTLAAWRPKYRVYTARISQTGTDAPTEDYVYENTLGSATWTYKNTGEYTLNIAGAFASNKTTTIQGALLNPNPASAPFYISGEQDGDSAFKIKTGDGSALVNDVIHEYTIEIRVYY